MGLNRRQGFDSRKQWVGQMGKERGSDRRDRKSEAAADRNLGDQSI